MTLSTLYMGYTGIQGSRKSFCISWGLGVEDLGFKGLGVYKLALGLRESSRELALKSEVCVTTSSTSNAPPKFGVLFHRAVTRKSSS